MCHMDHADVLKLLLAAGADTSLKDKVRLALAGGVRRRALSSLSPSLSPSLISLSLSLSLTLAFVPQPHSPRLDLTLTLPIT